MNKELAIKVENISKKYTIGRKKDSSLRGSFNNLYNTMTSKGSKEEFMALDNLSFEISKGEVLGVIGKNGAGKSTLLKLLSKITRPTSGRIEINGRVASLLEVGTGFHAELTGRENIFLNGTILGMTRKEVKSKLDEIVEFSGVHKFIDTPVKHYSSGMYVRLAFSVAAHLEPEILIIDEVLAVGDAEFQKKCLGKMGEVAGDGRTVIFVSHNLSSVKQLCSKGILLESGKVKRLGDLNSVINAYRSSGEKGVSYNNEHVKIGLFIREAGFYSDKNEFYFNDDIIVVFKLSNDHAFQHDIRMLIRVVDSSNNIVFGTETKLTESSSTYQLTIPKSSLTIGEYVISSIIYQPSVVKFDVVDQLLKFRVIDNIPAFSHLESFDLGNVYINCKWKNEKT